jgi:hypothetical protein
LELFLRSTQQNLRNGDREVVGGSKGMGGGPPRGS